MHPHVLSRYRPPRPVGRVRELEGTVLDQTGSAVPKAKISITNTDRNQVVRTVTTDTTGSYSVPLIPIGNYSLKVEAAGFKTSEVTGIVLNVNDDLKFNLKMEVGALTQTVEVKESSVQVELSSPAAANTIEGRTGAGIDAGNPHITSNS